MTRVRRNFEYANEDGGQGHITVTFGESDTFGEMPTIISFDDACWMGVEAAEEFQHWFKLALAEAKRLSPKEET